MITALRPLVQSLIFRPSSRPCLSLGLKPGKTWAGPVAAGTRVHCTQGRLWLSLDGEDEDVILEAGEAGALLRDGRLVAQGLA